VIKRKRIDKNHTLIFTSHFPYNTLSGSKSGHKALLGIGGNIGDVIRRFEHLFWYLMRSTLVEIVETAPILKNPPFGYVDQADFYNSLILVKTKLKPRDLLRYVLRVEKMFGRKRLFQDAPRTLDIDIIFYEDVTIESKKLTLPHPEWKNRNSVVIPLSYIKGRVI